MHSEFRRGPSALFAVAGCVLGLGCSQVVAVVNLSTNVAEITAKAASSGEPASRALVRSNVRRQTDRFALSASFDTVAAAAASTLAPLGAHESRRTDSRQVFELDDGDGGAREHAFLILHERDGKELEVRRYLGTLASHRDRERLAKLADRVATVPGVGAKLSPAREEEARPAPDAPAIASVAPPPAPSSSAPAPVSAAPSASAPAKTPKAPQKPKR